jgi:lipid II isoglutaminyl synthase (glutamine-hydrolysing)
VEGGTIVGRAGHVWDPQLSVPGTFNISNAACVLTAAELMSVDPRTALAGMRTVTTPAGRFATARFGDTTGCISDLAEALTGHPEPVDVIATYTPFHRLRKMGRV